MMNEFLLAIASFVVLLVPMIFLHELGHFIAAKLIGITVLEFGLGFPPRAIKLFERGGTEYTLNWLPLGGFVRPLGEDFVRPIGDEGSSQDYREAVRRGVKNPKSVSQAGPWGRMFFMAAGAGANALTAIVLFIVIALIGLPVARGTALQLYNIAPGSAMDQAGLQSGDLLLRLNDDYITSASAFTEYLYFNEGETISLRVERDGETFDTSMVVDAVEPAATSDHVVILDVAANTPAEQAGLQAGDIILQGDDTPINTVDSLVVFTDSHRGDEVSLLVERDGEQLTVSLTPRVSPPAGEGAIGVVITGVVGADALGFSYYDFDNVVIDYEPSDLGTALAYGFEQTVQTVSQIIEAPIQILRGEIDPSLARPLSIVGISQIGGQIIEESVEARSLVPALEFAALISLALGLTNLLPIPGLDGGRILFVIVELLRGKPLDPEREGMVHLIGLLLLLGIMGIFIVNDIVNPITLSFP
ncbi:MAG: RIP metalloprotease RseP [Anaerolineae bacterium]|nr:RIP metalloprotease RseP [Anaerolineae bacterium]